MLNVLILAYHFPPSNSSASHRPHSWVRHGKKYGFFPTVVTRHWKGLESDWLNFSDSCGDEIDYEVTEDHEIIRLPYRNTLPARSRAWTGNPVSRKAYFFLQTLVGRFHTQANVLETYTAFLNELLQNRSFDCIIATAPPYELYKVAAAASQRFSIPFVADIRDLWNDNLALQSNPSWTPKQRFNEKLSRHYTEKWMKQASLVTGISAPLVEIATKNLEVPNAVVTNGYEPDLYPQTKQAKNELFTLTLTGTIYPEQNFDVLLEGFQIFLQSRPRAILHFVGISILPEVAKKVTALLPAEYIRVSARIPKEEAIALTLSSDVLFYVGWQGYRGFYSGKIFEYLAARRNILIAPGDQDVVDELLEETKAGRSVNTSEEVAALLSSWYAEWEQNGILHYAGIEEKIGQYAREEQTKKLAGLLRNVRPKTTT